MTHIERTAGPTGTTAWNPLARIRGFWRGSLIESTAALHYREPEAFEAWLETRDIVMITAALSRLSDRQLDRIGLRRETLVLDIEAMMETSARNRMIVGEALELVEASERPQDRREAAHRMAAE